MLAQPAEEEEESDSEMDASDNHSNALTTTTARGRPLKCSYCHELNHTVLKCPHKTF
jgi:hypothetical protein